MAGLTDGLDVRARTEKSMVILKLMWGYVTVTDGAKDTGEWAGYF